MELFDVAMVAFRSARYSEAATLLENMSAEGDERWMTLLYLGLCYRHDSLTAKAHGTFMYLYKECPIYLIRKRAHAELDSMWEASLSAAASGEMRCVS